MDLKIGWNKHKVYKEFWWVSMLGGNVCKTEKNGVILKLMSEK
jgi:hypothetical protein